MANVFIPKSAFPLRLNLFEREQALLEAWNAQNLHDKQRAARAGAKSFVLHDGPPYANGEPHMGHARNRFLKDAVNRIAFFQGFDVPFVPGWDCHGLPIENRTEKDYLARGVDKRTVPAAQFRSDCRKTAQHWIDVQKSMLQQLGLMGDWKNYYSTMEPASELSIVRDFLQIFFSGHIARGTRPTWWSVEEETALAETEIEYKDIESQAVYVLFSVKTSKNPAWIGTNVAAWTSTPWTLPGNRAVCFNPALTYVRIETPEGKWIWVAEALLETSAKAMGLETWTVVETVSGSAFEGTVCVHPLGYAVDSPLLPGDHVTDTLGTGFVHTAPGHGAEDFAVGKQFGLEIPETVSAQGFFLPHLSRVGGQSLAEGQKTVIAYLKAEGRLGAQHAYAHSYPHSWRSKKPLIVRTTPQWFLVLGNGEGSLRQKALDAIETVRWIPESGKTRLRSMIEGRPDWCLSRQRLWGVPITLILEKATGQPVRDENVYKKVLEMLEKEGVEKWFSLDLRDIFGNDHVLYEKTTDIVDVWFESGLTHRFVAAAHPEVTFPADLYLEGSDQHRGWFNSSLVNACALGVPAPFRTVLTHDYIIDESSEKLSKSKGATSVFEEVKRVGADILRLWALGSDFTKDVKFGPALVVQAEDMYKRFRNVIRYLLGALEGFSEKEMVAPEAMPFKDLWTLHTLKNLETELAAHAQKHQLQSILNRLHGFCTSELSAFYVDISKDILYCDALQSFRRRSLRTVLGHVLHALLRWLAPFMTFTAEEAWLFVPEAVRALFVPNAFSLESVHLQTWPAFPDAWTQNDLAERMDTVLRVRSVVMVCLEKARVEKKIRAGLEASPVLYLPSSYQKALADVDLAQIFITSGAVCAWDQEPQEGAHQEGDVAVLFEKAEGEKCSRCWAFFLTLQETLCSRCAACLCEELALGV